MPLTPWRVPEYTALLSQFDTANPTKVILYNTLGNIVWTRVGAGQYTGVLTGAFGQNNTFITCNDNAFTGTDTIKVKRSDDDTILIWTQASGSLSDDILRSTPIKIQIYNDEN